MKWNHLPNAGGIYDQHPQLLEEWQYIFQEKAEHEEREQERERAKQKNSGKQSVR